MFNVGDKVSFFSLNEEFENVTNIDWYVEERNYYIITRLEDTTMYVKAKDGTKELKIENVFDEYQVFTADTLKEHLKSLNHQHIAICNKIKQLYRKQEFQFKGV